jgi:hypothetical protein
MIVMNNYDLGRGFDKLNKAIKFSLLKISNKELLPVWSKIIAINFYVQTFHNDTRLIYSFITNYNGKKMKICH